MNEINTLKTILQAAVNQVYNEDRFILKYKMESMKGLEQAFAFRVGLYLQEKLKNTPFESLDLDAEYNKSLGASKMLEEFPKGIRPDLILHQRGTHEKNILAIEFKGHWNQLKEKDIRKLIGLTSTNGDYKYTLGALVIINKDSADYTYYNDGEVI